MDIWTFLRTHFNKQKELDDESDLNLQVQHYSELFIKKYKKSFGNQLNYSLESFSIIDKIIEESNEKDIVLIENLTSYILHTLKKNYKGEILWNDFERQPMFLFSNNDYIEFFPKKYVAKQLKSKKVTNTLNLIIKLTEITEK